MVSKRLWLGIVFLAVIVSTCCLSSNTQAAERGQPSDWQRFYYYPYVYYPHNFSPPQQHDSLYYRYPQEMQIPVYNSSWYNFYPTEKPYYKGHHFILDVF